MVAKCEILVHIGNPEFMEIKLWNLDFHISVIYSDWYSVNQINSHIFRLVWVGSQLLGLVFYQFSSQQVRLANVL